MVFSVAAEGLGGHRGQPCRGVLRLPVHKFGILGYPYSSTPIGAPGPGPDSVPSAVGPGPKQCTGTHGPGHAESNSAPTAPPATARVNRGVVGEIVGGCLLGRSKRPPRPPYKQGKQGHFPHLRPSLLQSQKSPPPSSACRVERGQRSAPVAAATTSAVDLPHRLRHAPEAREGEGHEGRG